MKFDSTLKLVELENLYKEATLEEETVTIEADVVDIMQAIQAVRVREKPTIESREIRIIKMYEKVAVDEIIDGWAVVKDGYVMAKYLKSFI